MGKWRRKWENVPQTPVDMMSFNQRIFDPVNALISHSDKLELQSLAQAAAMGDPKAVQAYEDKLWNSGLSQDEKLVLGDMFMPKTKAPQKRDVLKASPQDLPGKGSYTPPDNPSNMGNILTAFMNQGVRTGIGNDINVHRDNMLTRSLTPEELEELHKRFALGSPAYGDIPSGGGRIKTVANEKNQVGPSGPKKSAKQKMQEKYGVTPRKSGRGQVEY